MAKQQYIDMAILEAKKSNMTHKHGAVIVYKGDVIACGHNTAVSFMLHKYSIHAEVDVIRKLKGKFDEAMFAKCDLYVVRINNVGEMRYSKPCSDCARTASLYGVGRVYYSV